MSINDKISVIVPVYNLEQYIEKTLDSICAQSYSNLEIIVVDDGSADKSFDIICDYAKKDSRVIAIHQENGGVTSARINGINHSNGEWIGFVDGDDLIDNDMYELLISNAYKYNADISHCGFRMILGDKIVNYHNTGKLVEQDNVSGQYDLLEGAMIEPALVNKLFKASLVKEFVNSNVMDYSIKNYEDLLMNYYLFKESKKSIFEDVCKYQYVVRKNSAATSQISEAKFDGPLRVFRTIMNDTKIESVYQKAFSRYIGFLIGFSTSRSKTYAKRAVIELKKNKKNVLSFSGLSKKTKIMYFLSAFFNPLYLLIRRVYEKITKVDKAFDVD